jgi:hypothetical protein
LLLVNLNTNLRAEAVLGQTAFDSPEIRATADVVPPALLRGPHYQLGPTVRTFAFMNQYSVTSDYGPFTATSDARLRRLIREIAAIAELQKIRQSDAFAKATVEAGKGVVQGAQHLIEDPVATIGAVPESFSVSLAEYRGHETRRQKQIRRRVAQNCSPYPASSANMHKSSISTLPSNEVLQKSQQRRPGRCRQSDFGRRIHGDRGGCCRLRAVCEASNRPRASSTHCRRSSDGIARRCDKCKADPVTERFREPLLSPRHQTVIVDEGAACATWPCGFIQYAAR